MAPRVVTALFFIVKSVKTAAKNTACGTVSCRQYKTGKGTTYPSDIVPQTTSTHLTRIATLCHTPSENGRCSEEAKSAPEATNRFPVSKAASNLQSSSRSLSGARPSEKLSSGYPFGSHQAPNIDNLYQTHATIQIKRTSCHKVGQK